MRPKPLVTVLLAVLPVVVLAAAACGGDDEGSTADEPASSTTAAADPPSVVLEPGALTAGDQKLLFGEASEGETVDALAAALGDAVREEELTECGEGPLRSVTFPSLVVYFQEGVLTGWRVTDDGPATLATGDGIGLGSTRAEVEEAFPEVTVDETSLGTELHTAPDGPSISALLTDDSPGGQVDEIWSGTTCIAR